MLTPETERLPLILALALALLTLLSFLPALGNGFVNYDDTLYVTHSPWRTEGLSGQGFVAAFRDVYASNWHPLTVLSHQLDVELFGLEPRGHHLVSVLFHTASVVLLFALLRALTGATWRSALAAALFAVHPLRVESVVWVAERKDVLSVFFGLLTLLAYVRYARRPGAARYALVAGCFALSLMAKAMLVTLPCVLLLLDLWPLRRLATAAEDRWRSALRLLAEKLPLLALAAAVSLATLLAQRDAMAPSAVAPLALRLANAATSYLGYLGKTFWPRGLAPFYPYPETIAAPTLALAVIVLLGLTAGALLAWRRAPALAVGWLWFLGTLVPVIGLLKFGNQALADRYSYFPSIGLAIAGVWGLHELMGRRSPRFLGVSALLVILVLAALTRLQIAHWQNSETLFRHTLAVTGPSALAHLNLAEALRAQGRLGEAEAHYRAALALSPGDGYAHAGLGEALRARGDLEAALKHFRAAVTLDPRDVRKRQSLAIVLADLGRDREAIEVLSAALALDPANPELHWGLGDLLARQGEIAAAIEHLRAALKANPRLEPVRRALVQLLLREGRREEAAAVLNP